MTSSGVGAVTLTTGATGNSSTFAGVIQDGSGTVALTKVGAGTLTLSGTNTYSGLTTVDAGTLTITGAIQGGLANNSIVNAQGTANGPISNNGVFNITSALSTNGDYTQGAGGTLTIDLGGIGPGEFSVLDVSGLVTLDGTVDFAAVNGFTPGTGDDFKFLLFGSASGNFASMDFTNWTCPTGDTCDEVVGADSLTLDISSAVPSSPTPEPSALLLFGTGAFALCGYLEKKGCCGSMNQI